MVGLLPLSAVSQKSLGGTDGGIGVLRIEPAGVHEREEMPLYVADPTAGWAAETLHKYDAIEGRDRYGLVQSLGMCGQVLDSTLCARDYIRPRARHVRKREVEQPFPLITGVQP